MRLLSEQQVARWRSAAAAAAATATATATAAATAMVARPRSRTPGRPNWVVQGLRAWRTGLAFREAWRAASEARCAGPQGHRSWRSRLPFTEAGSAAFGGSACYQRRHAARRPAAAAVAAPLCPAPRAARQRDGGSMCVGACVCVCVRGTVPVTPPAPATRECVRPWPGLLATCDHKQPFVPRFFGGPPQSAIGDRHVLVAHWRAGTF